MAPPVKRSDDELLDRALERFWPHGYGNTTIRDLERALKLTAPAIYHRFGNKDALFARVIERYVKAVIVPRVRAYLGTSEDPVVDLYRFFRTAQSPRGCLLTTAAIELGPTSSKMRARVEAGMDVMREALLAETRRLEEGAVARELAQALFLDLQGLMVLSRLGIADEELRRRTRMVFFARFGKQFKPRR
jgi:TetR/AcrR family transcriptional repressor of nem operon